MAVVAADIADALEALYTDAESTELTKAEFASEMANIIKNTILSADVTTEVAAGIAVQVTPATGTGATNAPGTGTGGLE